MQREAGSFRGPDEPPPQVYWRRRLGVFGAALFTVVLVAWSLGGDGGGSSGGTRPQAPDPKPAAATPSTMPHKRSSPRPTVTVTVTATPKSTVTVTATPDGAGRPCRKVDLRLLARTDKSAYGKGEEPRLTVRVKPQERCWIDPDQLGFVVTSGTDRIWSTRDCPGPERLPRRISPKHPYKATVTWPRARSNPAMCGERTEPARPGWYVLVATLGEREESPEAAFQLR